MEPTDKEYVERYRRGDVVAMDLLVERYRRRLFGYILKMTSGQDDADEIFQDVWIKVIRKIDTYRHDNLYGWLVRIAHNVIIDRVRRRKPMLSLDHENEEGGSMKEMLANGDLNPSEELMASDLGRSIDCALQELSLEQREVFVMRSQGALSFKEIAAIQKTPLNTALARMHYAVRKLRSLLRDRYAELGAI